MTKKEMRKQIEALTARLTYLENMHARLEKIDGFPWSYTPLAEREYVYEGMFGRYNRRDLTRNEIREVIGCPHPQIRECTASTKNISNITFNELAKFVIDGAPIKRECSKSVTYKSTYTPESVTKSVKTDLGDITITEGID
jgi:hypothetical protein